MDEAEAIDAVATFTSGHRGERGALRELRGGGRHPQGSPRGRALSGVPQKIMEPTLQFEQPSGVSFGCWSLMFARLSFGSALGGSCFPFISQVQGEGSKVKQDV